MAAGLSVLALAGCAGLEITNFKNGNVPDRGYVVYRPVQYVVVADAFNDDGAYIGQSITPIVLPNPREGSAIRLERGLGAGSIELSVTDGWRLSSLNAETDNQIDEFITAASGAVASGRPPAADANRIPSGLYRVDYDEAGLATRLVPIPFNRTAAGN
jgi:hypothetical protein